MVVTVRAAARRRRHARPTGPTEIWSGTHVEPARQRRQSARRRGAARSAGRPPPVDRSPEASGGGGTRNGEPLYDIAAKRIIHHLVPETPVRTSSLRGLGAMLNVFAIESLIDELAERAGEDPVAYRLSILSEPRARAVIERVAGMADWRAARPPAPARGRGIAFARYKNRAAYAAVVAEVEVDERRSVCVASGAPPTPAS